MKAAYPIRFGLFVSALALAISSSPALGGFFQILEKSPAGLGNAFAGGAAVAEDPSTVWYNPAGLTRLEGNQFIAGGYVLDLSIKFDDAGSTITPLVPSPPFNRSLGTNEGDDAGDTELVPNVYFTRQVDDRMTFGVGVTAPFGLVTDWETGWIGRYHADKSDIRTIDVNPGVGYTINDDMSVGFGVSLQFIEAELTQDIDTGTIDLLLLSGLNGLVPTMDDSFSKLTADDISFGYNAGFLWELNDKTRLGAAFRSPIRYRLVGDAEFSTRPPCTTPSQTSCSVTGDPGVAMARAAILAVDTGIQADITLPATFSVSVYHQLNPRLAIMGDVTQTRWGRLPELRIKFDNGGPPSVVTLDLDDVLRYSVGVTFRPNGRWTYRGGIALDKTPTPNAQARTPRLPDEDRTWLTFGAGYQRSETFSLDFAVALIEVDEADIAKSTDAPGSENFFRGNLVGEFDADTQIVSVQGNWKFQTR